MSIAPSFPVNPAPWAEVVPEMGPMTANDLLCIPDDGYVYEVVAGVLVRMAGSGFQATTIGLTLAAELRAYVRPLRLGIVTSADGVYQFLGAETGLIPDVGFFSMDKRGLIDDPAKPIPFAPDLAVEVVSPSQNAEGMAAKARTYLDGGTRLVWVVWPQSLHIDVWHPDVLMGPVRSLSVNDVVDGEDVIPGFTYPVAGIFADPLA